MAIPIIDNWKEYFINPDEGLGSSYERIVLNNKLMEICEKYHIKKILEAPLFGFTGISGINSIALAKTKHHITLVDHDQERMELIRQTWIKLNINADFNYLEDYYQLPFPAKVFDFSWNFSALWFVRDLEKFLSELSRVTSQAILICVPNRSGLGYLTQKWGNGSSTLTRIYEENINPALFCNVLHLNGWKLEEQGYIDCPPWPDIGMPKEKFLRKIGMGWLFKQNEKTHQTISIMDYYSDRDESFPERMMKHYWLERKLPGFLKRFWAHHRYFLFIPERTENGSYDKYIPISS